MIQHYNKSGLSGWTGTVVIHVLLLVVFLFVKCSSDLPVSRPDDIGGILINFGESDDGLGEAPSEIMTESPETKTHPVTETSLEKNVTETEVSEAVKTQETEDAPAVNSGEQPVADETENKEELPAINPMALYKKDRNPGVTANEGKAGTTGDQGSPDGSPLSDNYSQGKGEGYNWTLGGAGRKLVGKIEIVDESQETGKVVVQITVDRTGSVTGAIPVLLGSTTTNQYLWKLAKQGALTARFSPDPSAPEEQRGTIVFDFKLLK